MREERQGLLEQWQKSQARQHGLPDAGYFDERSGQDWVSDDDVDGETVLDCSEAWCPHRFLERAHVRIC